MSRRGSDTWDRVNESSGKETFVNTEREVHRGAPPPALQGYLAHKKPPPPRTLQQDHA